MPDYFAMPPPIFADTPFFLIRYFRRNAHYIIFTTLPRHAYADAILLIRHYIFDAAYRHAAFYCYATPR